MKKLRFVTVLGLVAACLRSLQAAEPIQLMQSDGSWYTNLNVLTVTGTDLFFKHDGGFSSLKLKYLPTALQTRFDYNPSNAAALEKSYLAGNRAYHARFYTPPAPEKTNLTNPSTNTVPGTTNSARNATDGSVPELVVDRWLSSQPDTRNKPMLICFWTTWSLTSRRAVIRLNELNRTFGEKVLIIGISEEAAEDIEALAEPRIEYYSASDPEKRLKQTLGVTSQPYAIILDTAGSILWEGNPLNQDKLLTDKVMSELFP